MTLLLTATGMPSVLQYVSSLHVTARLYANLESLTRQQSAFEGGVLSAFAALTTVALGQTQGCLPTDTTFLSEQVGRQHLQQRTRRQQAMLQLKQAAPESPVLAQATSLHYNYLHIKQAAPVKAASCTSTHQLFIQVLQKLCLCYFPLVCFKHNQPELHSGTHLLLDGGLNILLAGLLTVPSGHCHGCRSPLFRSMSLHVACKQEHIELNLQVRVQFHLEANA
jgi:hypothetical protein